MNKDTLEDDNQLADLMEDIIFSIASVAVLNIAFKNFVMLLLKYVVRIDV